MMMVSILAGTASYMLLKIVRLTTTVHTMEENQWQWSRGRSLLASDVWQAATVELHDADSLSVTSPDGRVVTWNLLDDAAGARLERAPDQAADTDALRRADWAAPGTDITFEAHGAGVLLHVEGTHLRRRVTYSFPQATAMAKEVHHEK